MGCTFCLVKIGNTFAYFMVSCLLARWRYYSILISKQRIFDCKIKLCPGRQGKYIFTHECFYLQGIFNDITEQNTSLLGCKHKHMMKCGAPPDKIRVLHRSLPIEFHGFTSRIDSKLSLFGSWSYLSFLQMVWFPLKHAKQYIRSVYVHVSLF